MKPPRFAYTRPASLPEAVEALAAAGGSATILAGGQSLVPLLNYRLARPEVVVDLNIIEELTTIYEDEGTLILGAMVRQRAAEVSPIVGQLCPIIPRALRHVGHVQIRHRGTVGGSIAHADPAAELPAVALCLDARMVAQSPRGRREIEAADFFTGPFTTALERDEILTQVRIPAEGARKGVFMEFARRSGDFALAGVAVSIELENAKVAGAALAALGVGATPMRLRNAEVSLVGSTLDSGSIREAADVATREVEPLDDIHADEPYRRSLLGTLVRRALSQVAA